MKKSTLTILCVSVVLLFIAFVLTRCTQKPAVTDQPVIAAQRPVATAQPVQQPQQAAPAPALGTDTVHIVFNKDIAKQILVGFQTSFAVVQSSPNITAARL